MTALEHVGNPQLIAMIERIAGLATSDAVSRAVRSEQVLRSIVLFGSLYVLLGVLWVYLMHKKIQHGPEPDPDEPGGPLRPGLAEAPR